MENMFLRWIDNQEIYNPVKYKNKKKTIIRFMISAICKVTNPLKCLIQILNIEIDSLNFRFFAQII